MELSYLLTPASILLSAFLSAWWIRRQINNNTRLHRKDIAIKLLNDNRYNECWRHAQEEVFRDIFTPPNRNWMEFAERKFAGRKELSEKEQELSKCVTMVLNHYEHLSMAVLTETADEEIVKASQRHVMSKLHEAFVCYIKKVREINKEPNLYNHFEELVQRWQKSPGAAGPVSQ